MNNVSNIEGFPISENFDKYIDQLDNKVSMNFFVELYNACTMIPKHIKEEAGTKEALETLEDIVKTLTTDKRCRKCGAILYCSDWPQYDYICVDCNEKF